MKILDFFRKKGTEEDSNQETNTESSLSHIIYEQEKIDEMLQNPGFEVYKPFLRVHRDELAKLWAEQFELTHQIPIYDWRYEIVRTAYYRGIISILIHNINLYIRAQKKEPINFGSLELFLLEVLAAELKITNVPVVIDESEIENMMECNDMRILYRNFMEARNHWIKTDYEVIIDLIYKCDRDRAPYGRFYRKTNIDEIRNLINDPEFPDGYTEFALYNDHLLYTTWKDFRNQVDPDIALSKYVELVYDIVVWTHVCRVDSKHKESRSTNGLIRYAYNHALIDACLKEHVCWFPSEEQTKNIIERMPEKIDEMNTISEVEKPFGEELPESARKTPAKSKKKELPPNEQAQFNDLLIDIFIDEDHPFIKLYYNELLTIYCLGRVAIDGVIIEECTRGAVSCMMKAFVTETLRDYHDGYLTPSNIRHVAFKSGTTLQQAIFSDMDAWDIILNISLILLVESNTITADKNLDDPDVQTKHILAGVRAYMCGRYTDHGITTVEEYNAYKETGKYPSKDKNELPDEWNPVEKSWDEFRNTGLVQITNQFLHIFGWALTYAKDGDELRVFPARVRYRGFDVDSQTRAYEKLQKYMIENAETLYKESDYEDEEN